MLALSPPTQWRNALGGLAGPDLAPLAGWHVMARGAHTAKIVDPVER